MMEQIVMSLALLAIARAGTSAPLLTPATSSSPPYSPIYNPPNSKAKATPAPIYEDVPIQETGIHSVDNIGQEPLKSDSRIFHTDNINTGSILTHTIPNVYDDNINPTLTSSQAKTINGPVTYTTHTHSTPFEERIDTISPHTAITQNEAIKTAITYAEAPAVSHMTFTGLGTTYTW